MVSNAILYDPLLVRYLAEELDRTLRGRACAAAPLFAADRSVVLALDRGEALRLDLHPTRGWTRLVPRADEAEELDALCLGVESPPDERRLEIRMRTGGRFRVAERRLVVELHSNQWNALLVSEEDGRIVSALRARAAGERALYPGQPYRPPPPAGRAGAASEAEGDAWRLWLGRLEPVPPGRRRDVLLESFAYTGTPNAAWILGESAAREGEAELRAAFRRWWWLRGLPPRDPRLIRTAGRIFPYPLPLSGLPGDPVASLLEGMERVATEAVPEAEAGREREEWERWVARRGAAAERRVRRLEEELAGAGEAERLRSWGDLLLAHLHALPRGDAEARLDDWEGTPVRIPLDPALSPAENAARFYDAARRRERADARIPELLEEAREERERWRAAEQAVADGEMPAWVEREMERAADSAESGPAEEAETRPYRSYRTSGGLEVRVGRSARDNDRTTFGHSRPDDVWLHARSVAGSHVILRWDDPESAPPARDLQEAATLAALFSKARTSALVPVDWTRRKHVRKPRGAPPGSVVPQRVRTLFVEPDAGAEERMRG